MTAEEWEKKWGSLPQEPFEEKNAEIERLKTLLTSAADALKKMEVNWPNEKKGDYDSLIRQLRKAAK